MQIPQTIEDVNLMGKGCLPGLVGIEFTEIDSDVIIAKLPVREELLAPNGFLHAASIIALADTVAGFGTVINLPQGADSFTTIELKSNFFGTATEGNILATGKPVHRGRSTQVWDVTVINEATGKNIALFRCSQMILWPK